MNNKQSKLYGMTSDKASRVKTRGNRKEDIFARLINGIVLQHNFIEEHTTLRDFPCERAGLKLEVGQNRWLGSIKMASLE